MSVRVVLERVAGDAHEGNTYKSTQSRSHLTTGSTEEAAVSPVWQAKIHSVSPALPVSIVRSEADHARDEADLQSVKQVYSSAYGSDGAEVDDDSSSSDKVGDGEGDRPEDVSIGVVDVA